MTDTDKVIDVAESAEDIERKKSDEEYLASKIITFMRELKGMPEETFKEGLNEIRFLHLCSVIRTKYIAHVGFDANLNEVTEDMVYNTLGNLGFIVSYNVSIGKWQCVMNLQGAILIIYDETKAITVLRAAIFKYSGGQYYQNVDIIQTYQNLWKKANEKTGDVYSYTVSAAEKAALEIGTTLETIAKDIERQELEDAQKAQQ